MDIVTLLPPENGDFTQLETALLEADNNEDSITELVFDEELECRVVQLIGSASSLEMPCKTTLPYLQLQLKNLGRFICLEVILKCSDNRKRRIICSNQQSTSRITKDGCSMPLELQSNGWNYLSLNLPSLTKTAFGLDYCAVSRVTIFSSCRIRGCYFSDREYSDIELPKHLRVTPME